jgi:hypothetical protein
VYRNRTDNQLLSYNISPQAGFPSYQSNLPATVQNAGVELTLTSSNVKTQDFSWSTSINISRNRNKLVSFPNLKDSGYGNTYEIGTSISSYRLYKYTGLSEATGLPTIEDRDGSGTISSSDQSYYGARAPKYFGGVTNTVSWKGFTLDFTFQFVKQQGQSLLAQSYMPSYLMNNLSAQVVQDYLALGDENKLVLASRPGNLAHFYYAASDAVLVDASFIRLKNVSLSYTLPSVWLAKAKIQNARLYVQGQNLFTITNYEGYDPESRGLSTPPLRNLTAGLQFTF